jgi:dTDP-4-amino-4,6-dideoxygalactose transaminase
LNALDGGAVISHNTDLINIINDSCYYDDQLEWDGQERFNFRFLNLHAAIGLESLAKIQETKSKISRISDFYYKLFNETSVSYLDNQFQNNTFPLKMLVIIPKVDQENFTRLFLKNHIEVSRELVYVGNGSPDNQETELMDVIWSLPFYENLSEKEMQRIRLTLREYAKLS